MKGWTSQNPNQITETEQTEQVNVNSSSNQTYKVRITKSLITLADVLRFSGELDSNGCFFGSYGIGVISEDIENSTQFVKGNRVYIEPVRPCGNCYNCKNGKSDNCSDLMIAGEDFNGFLCDFVSLQPKEIYSLPENVSDAQALFIGQISLALSVFDKLNIQKGDYVAILGANNFGNIFAQLLIYYQAVPIVLTNNSEDYQNAKDSGIYYVFNENDNWQKDVSQITSGRMTDKVVYISDCEIPVSKAFALASHNAQVSFTGLYYKSNSVSFLTAMKKQLDILCVNNGYGNTETSINLLANKAIDFSHIKIDNVKYDEIPKAFEKLAQDLSEDKSIADTIVDMI